MHYTTLISLLGLGLNVLPVQSAVVPVDLARRGDDSIAQFEKRHDYGIDADEVAHEKRHVYYNSDEDEVAHEKRHVYYNSDEDEAS